MYQQRSALLIVLVIMAVVFLSGCPERREEPSVKVTPPKTTEGGKTRFNVESFGVFQAGYRNNEREILIITDSVTGQKFIGITGVGVTEFHMESSGKSSVPREE